MNFNRTLADRKTQAYASRLPIPRVCYSIERTKHIGQCSFRYSYTLVQNTDDRVSIVTRISAAQRNLYFSAVRSVGHCVPNHVLYRASQKLLVTKCIAILARDYSHSPVAATRFKVGVEDDLIHEPFQIYRVAAC
jgi:hypothetical protein